MIGGVLAALWAVASGLLLVALAWRLGALLLARTPLRADTWLERLLLETGLGLVLLSYVPMGLGAFTALTFAAVRITLIGLALMVLVIWWLKRLENKERPAHDKGGKMPAWALGVIAVIALFLFGSLIFCLTPMTDYDGLAYHVAAPKRWLELGALQYLPTQLHTQWPMGVEMLYTLLLPVAGVGACKPLIALFAALTAAAIYALGARIASREAGLVAAGLWVVWAGFFAAPGINSTSIEIPLACYVVLSALALAIAQGAEAIPERRAGLILGAVFAGFACCVKLNGLLACVFLMLAVLMLPRPAGATPRERIFAAIGFGSIAILCASPWYARTWINTGNPVYPFAYGLLDGRHWNMEAARVLTAYFRSFNLPGDTLAARHAVVVRQMLKLGLLTTISVALPGPRWTRLFFLAAGMYALVQMIISDQWRLLLPAVPFAALAAGWWIARAALRWPIMGWGVTAALAVIFLPAAVRETMETVPVVLSPALQETMIRRYVNNRDAFLWANRSLPAGVRILYGPDNRTYYLDRPVYWSSAVYQQQIVYDTPQAFAASLRREGISYLILNRRLYKDSAIAFEVRVGWRANEQRRLEEVAARSTVLWQGDDVTIYRLP